MRRETGASDTARDGRRLLQQLPNVGPAVAGDLLRLGVTAPAALAGQDPEALYERLCALDGVRHDPCLLDVFTAIVARANGELRPRDQDQARRDDRDAGRDDLHDRGVVA